MPNFPRFHISWLCSYSGLKFGFLDKTTAHSKWKGFPPPPYDSKLHEKRNELVRDRTFKVKVKVKVNQLLKSIHSQKPIFKFLPFLNIRNYSRRQYKVSVPLKKNRCPTAYQRLKKRYCFYGVYMLTIFTRHFPSNSAQNPSIEERK